MANKNAGIEAIKKLREKKKAEQQNETQEEPIREEITMDMLHNDGLFRLNVLLVGGRIEQKLDKLIELLGGEEQG